MRGALYSAAFLVVALVAGLVQSWWALLAAAGRGAHRLRVRRDRHAATTYMTSWQDFDYITLAIQPMFLFSATFYPLSTYPRVAAVGRAGDAALPGGRARTRADARRGGLGAARPRRLPRGARRHRHRRGVAPDREAAARPDPRQGVDVVTAPPRDWRDERSWAAVLDTGPGPAGLRHRRRDRDRPDLPPRGRARRVRGLPAARRHQGTRPARAYYDALRRHRLGGRRRAVPRDADVARQPRLGREARGRGRRARPRPTPTPSNFVAALAEQYSDRRAGRRGRRPGRPARRRLRRRRRGRPVGGRATTTSRRSQAFADGGGRPGHRAHHHHGERGGRHRAGRPRRRAAGRRSAFTVETDGRLPDGTAAAATPSRRSTRPAPPDYFMVNCAHPTHFAAGLDGGAAPGWHGSAASAPTPRRSATPSSTRPRSSTRATPRSSAHDQAGAACAAARPARRSAAAAGPIARHVAAMWGVAEPSAYVAFRRRAGAATAVEHVFV